MSDFAPPTGPPPPKVPAGWKAVWNDQYHEWFYVNTFSKKSQWDKPTEPAYGPGDDAPPGAPPPNYDQNQSRNTGPEKTAFGSNNPYGGPSGPSESDEAMARRLQAEEEARAQGRPTSRGASDSYYQGSAASPYGQQPLASGAQGSPYGQQLPPRDDGSSKSKGLFSKLSSKLGGGSSRPQQYGGGYPQQGYGGYPQQSYGGYPPQQGYGGYQQQGGYYQQQQQQRKTGGMGAMGGAALGLGAGVIGGALITDAIEDHDQNEYNQGYENGADNGGGDNGGGDYGGGDYGGGDDGGDMGGGDF